MPYSTSLNTQEAAKEITRDNEKWGDLTLGTAATVSYGFLSNTNGLQFSGSQIAATRAALDLWSDVANITFRSPTDPLESPYISGGIASITFVNFDDAEQNSNGAAEGSIRAGHMTVGLNLAHSDGNLLGTGEYDMATLIHEVGHAIGLSHPGYYSAGNVDEAQPTYFADAGYRQDTEQYSVMSYFSEEYTGADFLGIEPMTPLLHDIAAAQRLYGVNWSTRTGDTVYGFNSNADREAFRIADDSEQVVFAIWDAGGNDTLDLSGYSHDQIIRLNPGAFSNAGGLVGNIAIAEGAIIENAIGGWGDDRIFGNNALNKLYGGLGNDYIDGGNGNDTIEGGYGDDMLYGGAGNDLLRGGYGNDYIDGGSGVDIMEGGEGDDTYYVDDKLDRIVERAGINTTGFGAVTSGVDTVETTLTSYVLQDGLENLSFAGEFAFSTPSNRNGVGNESSNRIIGRSGNDTLSGLGGNDTIDGGAGADNMAGGAGDDVYVVDDVGDFISERQALSFTIGGITQTYFVDAGGSDLVRTTLSSYTLPTYLENLTFTGTDKSFEGQGNGLDNLIIGGDRGDYLFGLDGNDTLNGLAGADTMFGGAGNDVYHVDNAGDVVDDSIVVPLGGFITRIDGGGIDEVRTSLGEYKLGTYIENLTYTGSNGFKGTGNYSDNRIIGGQYADVLIGGGGNDTLIGGGDQDSLEGGDGHDLLVMSDDDLEAIAPDRIDGGNGIDTLDLGQLKEGVEFNLGTGYWRSTQDVLGARAPVVAADIRNIENVLGSSHDDRLIGDEGANVISGGEGRDTLEGGSGNDTLNGDGGNDKFVMSGAISALGWDAIDGGAGTDTLDASQLEGWVELNLSTTSVIVRDNAGAYAIGTIANVENATGGEHFDYLIGNEAGNRLSGNGDVDWLVGGGGNDSLIGGAGADVMVGGTGDDTYAVDDAGDSVVEYADEGWDIVVTNLSEYSLGAQVEEVQSVDFDMIGFHGIGNELNNIIVGATGDDYLDGGAGNDVLRGEINLFRESVSNDRLRGGLGDDILYGGGGADMYIYADGDAGQDWIIGFNEAEGDRLDFSGMTGVLDFTGLAISQDVKGNAVVAFGDASITLDGVDAASLDGSEFLFANGGPAPAGAGIAGFLAGDPLMPGEGEAGFADAQLIALPIQALYF